MIRKFFILTTTCIWGLAVSFVCLAAHEQQEDTPHTQGEPFIIDLSIVGDCTLATFKGENYAGSFNWYAERYAPDYFFEKVRDIFESDDFTIANLENVLTDNPLPEAEKGSSRAFWFKAPTRHCDILKAASIEAVSLANNHTKDYGRQGLEDTIAAVRNAGIEYGAEDRTFYLEKNGFVIAVICHGLWYESQAAQIEKRIQQASRHSDYQIVFYHGGAEAHHHPEPWRVRASRRLVDAGADLVLGNHPHVLQPVEVYNGAYIVYSLGNFCFGGNSRPENATMICKLFLTVSEGRLQKQEVYFIPCYVYTGEVNNWQPAPIDDPLRIQYVLDFLNALRERPY